MTKSKLTKVGVQVHDGTYVHTDSDSQALWACSYILFPLCHLGNHMLKYATLGHPYIRNYSVSPEYVWALSMSPMQSNAVQHIQQGRICDLPGFI